MKFKARFTVKKTFNYSDEKENSGFVRKYVKLYLLLIISLIIFPALSFGQCDTDVFLDKCSSNLGTYNYIKSFVTNANPQKKTNPEFSYVFSKGSTYIMIACTENEAGGNLIISLYDRNHYLIASTYDEKTKKYYNELQYPCSATGVYYIKATFEGTKKACGMCILGFSRN